MTQSQKERIKELRAWAKDNLLDKEVSHPEFPRNIGFSSSGIKEFLNQPHCNYFAKNELLLNLDVVIQNSKVVFDAEDMNGNPNHHFFYLLTFIEYHPSYIVIRLTRHDNKYTLYSIVDKLKNR